MKLIYSYKDTFEHYNNKADDIQNIGQCYVDNISTIDEAFDLLKQRAEKFAQYEVVSHKYEDESKFYSFIVIENNIKYIYSIYQRIKL